MPVLIKKYYSHSRYCIYNTISYLFIRNKICYGTSIPHISDWSMLNWSVVGWSVIGGRWSVGQWF